jgi:hypothetical protein
MNHLYSALVRAETAQKETAAAHEQVARQIASIHERLAEKSQARAQIIGDLQAGKIDETLAALRLAVIDADTRDLSTLLTQAQQRDAVAVADVEAAALALTRANTEVIAHEREQAAKALDAAIALLEEKLLGALAQRYHTAGRTNNSLWGIWQPSVRLAEAVPSHCAPV